MTSLLGHDPQARTLLGAARSGRLHHGWILAGPRGIGKASFARAMALRLLAEAAGPPVTGEGLDVPPDHPIRRLFEAEAHPDYADLYCLEKESGTARNITVDQIRGLQRLIQSAPSMSSRRVVVIDSADDLERGAANALLKNLEEPPADMLFLLVSHAPGRLLPTIRSRCRTLRFDALSDDAMRSILRAADETLPAKELEALVHAGEGSPGKALRYAGLNIADIEQSLAAIAADGDPGNRQRLILAKALASKAARPRYEAFLERAPAFIAEAARQRQGNDLGQALDHWEAARQLAGGAIILSLEPGAVVFELAGHVAALAR
ncbi:DNA polymerase III delta' subunit [Sphingobium chlorophenolicum L-1]|uniref:DNA polymerase III delta' subunit n=1 Tax=Sphingobium chlorophenolicum L-1 TaxID=690566 RepID=F6EZD5_SPHCR|nr:AAA family ATPase [Sphingobium chlorophenolicum]AEG48411.1 DNA polymerase III delta' subunit [Sphingobium chlorophenolicum L-1]